eukprot:IDg14162t1
MFFADIALLRLGRLFAAFCKPMACRPALVPVFWIGKAYGQHCASSIIQLSAHHVRQPGMVRTPEYRDLCKLSAVVPCNSGRVSLRSIYERKIELLEQCDACTLSDIFPPAHDDGAGWLHTSTNHNSRNEMVIYHGVEKCLEPCSDRSIADSRERFLKRG